MTFWGKNWNGFPGARTELREWFPRISNSAWQGILTAYFDHTGPVSKAVTVSSWTDETILAPTGVTNERVEDEINFALSQNGWPAGGRENLYVVLPAPGAGFTHHPGCGEHHYSTVLSSPYLYFGWPGDEAFAGCRQADPTGQERAWVGASVSLSHEYAESVTDTETKVNAGQYTGWLDTSLEPLGEGEIADLDCGQAGNVNGAYVQRIWDISAGVCALEDANPPQYYAITRAASNITTLNRDVMLNGTIDPGARSTTVQFEWGLTTAYGNKTPSSNVGSGSVPVDVSRTVTQFAPNTTYHYRVIATNDQGYKVWGEDRTFTTPDWPDGTPATIIDPGKGLTSAWRGTDGNLYETVAVGGKWTTFSPTFGQLPNGVTVASDPSLALDKSNGVVAVWRGSNNHIYETLVFNGSWTTFEPTWGNLPAGISARGNPAAVIDPVNGLSIEWRGSDGNVYETVAPGGKWTTFSPTWSTKPSGVTVTSDPAAVIDPANGLSIEWRGSDGNVYETVAPGGGNWTTFSPTWSTKPSGVTVTSDPAAVIDPVNGLSIEWRGSDGNVYETVAPGGGSWTTFSPTWEGKPAGINAVGDPAAVIDPTNGLTIDWRGSDGQLYQTGAPGSGKWNTFSPTFGRLSGVTASGRPAAAVDSSGNLKTAWRGSDGNLFETYPTSGYWTSVGITAFSLPTGVTIVGEPAMIKDPTNGVVAVVRGSDGNLYEALLANGNWTTFSPTWEGKPAGVTVTGTPALAITPTSGLTMSWRGSDGNLYVTRPVNGKWGTFSPTSGNMPSGVTVLGNPSAVYDSANGLSIEWRGSDGNVYETVAPDGKWTTFSPTWSNKPSGVTVASDPAAVLDPVNGISIVWRGSNNHLYETVAPGGGSWTTFEQTWGNLPTGVTVTGNPAAIIDPTNGLASGWRGSDGNVYETVSAGGKWTTFSPTWENKPTGVTVASDPSLVITSSGITFLWRGTNANVEETVSINGKWTTFAPTWGAIFGKVALGE